MATALSRINNIIWVIIRIIIIEFINDGPVLPNSVINKWPAIIFAVNRIARVPGRIIFLIVSIHTINDINIEGVPWGTRWINMCCVFINHPYTIKVNQRGRANEKVITIWLVLVKM